MNKQKELIKEIEWLKENAGIGLTGYGMGYVDGVCGTCDKLLDFINSLPEEPVSKDLEEAAVEYCGGNKGADARVRAGFVMGAQWQKEQDQKSIELAEDHAYFAGSEAMREKLVTKACEWWENELSYPSMTQEEIRWYRNKVKAFRKAMEEKL